MNNIACFEQCGDGANIQGLYLLNKDKQSFLTISKILAVIKTDPLRKVFLKKSRLVSQLMQTLNDVILI